MEQHYLEFGEPYLRSLSLPSDRVSSVAIGMLELRGWTRVRIVEEGWADHPLGGRAWSILLEGYPPEPPTGNAEIFDPTASAECNVGLHEACVDTTCGCYECR